MTAVPDTEVRVIVATTTEVRVMLEALQEADLAISGLLKELHVDPPVLVDAMAALQAIKEADALHAFTLSMPLYMKLIRAISSLAYYTDRMQAPAGKTVRERFEAWYDAQPNGRLEPWDVWQAAIATTQAQAGKVLP